MIPAQSPPSRVDLRGFSYALSPYVRQQEWHMDSLKAQLARAQRLVVEAQGKFDAMGASLRAQSAHIQQGLHQRPDPSSHQRGLSFLAQLQQRITDQKRSLLALESERLRLQSECLAQLRKLDGLEEHRTVALHDYASQAAQREATEADRDWLGRFHTRAAPRRFGPEAGP